MHTEKTKKILFSTLWCLFLFSVVLNGQGYRFRDFGTKEKLPDNYVFMINQDNNGFLWLGTGSGLVKFDGFKFYKVVFPDLASNRYSTVSLKDRNGNLWFGCNDGSLFYTNNNNLVQIKSWYAQSISAIFESSDGYIWVIPQDSAIFRINENNPSEISRFNVANNIQMTTGALVSEGRILIGTQENLLYCSLLKDSLKIEKIIDGIDYSKVQSILPLNSEGEFVVGVQDDGIYKLKVSNNIPVLTRFPDNKDLESIDVKSLFRDRQGFIWVATSGSGLYQILLSQNKSSIESKILYNSASRMAGENVNTVFQDMEGNIWIGFYGADKGEIGMSVLTTNAFSFFPPTEKPGGNNIIYINQKGNGYLLGTPEGYFQFNSVTGKAESFTDLRQQVRQNEILSYLLDKSDRLWIGTKSGGLFLKSNNGEVTQFYRSGNNSEDVVRHIASDGKNLWLSTIDGVILVDINTATVRRKFKNDNRLPHNYINQILIKKDGNALVATYCDRLYSINPAEGVTIGKGKLSGEISRNEVTCFTETGTGGIWAGTAGNGIFYIENDSVTRITTENGLLSDYCRSILATSDNQIWIGHERGFSQYNINTGSVKVSRNDFAKGGDCNYLAIFETTDKKVLIGTREGLICYDPKKDKKIVDPPISNILSVTINDSIYPYQKSYSLPYKKRNKIVVDFVGVYLTDPGKVSYQTKMDNISETWSEIDYSRQVTYYPGDGKYKFNLKSIGVDGLTNEIPVSFDLMIKKPVWRTWWFFLLMIAAISGLVAIIISIREKSQKEMQDYLEKELAERTRLVFKQKDEIELQNIEITDSINYAKRIQSSILPDANKLRDTFNDAFIIFHPRDIVSGDFYWFDKIDEERFVVVCADSTGHGVPGAFMSMIGSTLLQDIVSRKKITRPSEVLTLLDKQIFATLNQNVDVGVSNDGMDMVVFEFNVKTRHIRFASAMRPVIIVLEGEPYYIRGNRCSVGGESVVEKFFDDQEYYLAKGDTIYMFSDGLPDQFGGADGKKMKIARLKQVISEVSSLPMAKQKEIISNFYFDWKGDYEQVDDILLMGIKV